MKKEPSALDLMTTPLPEIKKGDTVVIDSVYVGKIDKLFGLTYEQKKEIYRGVRFRVDLINKQEKYAILHIVETYLAKSITAPLNTLMKMVEEDCDCKKTNPADNPSSNIFSVVHPTRKVAFAMASRTLEHCDLTEAQFTDILENILYGISRGIIELFEIDPTVFFALSDDDEIVIRKA